MTNLVIFSGNLSKEPELRKTNSGFSVANCSIALNKGYGEKKKTDFVNFTTFKQNAEFLTKWFHKGDPIEIKGELSVRSYTDKEGNKRTAIEVLAQTVDFCPRKGKSKESADSNAAPPVQGGQPNINVSADFDEMDIEDEDLPF